MYAFIHSFVTISLQGRKNADGRRRKNCQHQLVGEKEKRRRQWNGHKMCCVIIPRFPTSSAFSAAYNIRDNKNAHVRYEYFSHLASRGSISWELSVATSPTDCECSFTPRNKGSSVFTGKKTCRCVCVCVSARAELILSGLWWRKSMLTCSMAACCLLALASLHVVLVVLPLHVGVCCT